MSENNKLNPCPFCGGTNIIIKDSENGVDEKAWCIDCQANIPRFKGKRSELIEAWNIRKDLSRGEIMKNQQNIINNLAEVIYDNCSYDEQYCHPDGGCPHGEEAKKSHCIDCINKWLNEEVPSETIRTNAD